jgi:hypothetical protein
MGFELVLDKQLSRWRNMAHPVSRRFFVLRVNHIHGVVVLNEELGYDMPVRRESVAA